MALSSSKPKVYLLGRQIINCNRFNENITEDVLSQGVLSLRSFCPQ
jgi:hypothetical protein